MTAQNRNKYEYKKKIQKETHKQLLSETFYAIIKQKERKRCGNENKIPQISDNVSETERVYPGTDGRKAGDFQIDLYEL